MAQNVYYSLLEGRRLTSSARIATIPRKYSFEGKIARITQSLGLNYLHYVGTFDIPKHNLYQEADLLNFHNLHSGTFNYLAIPSLTKNKPAVFTLHDMWSLTGHCAYSYDCDRWKTGCGNCPYPNSYPVIKRDNTRLEWQLKNWVYSRAKLAIVTPSSWLAEQAKQSMLNRFSIHHIPNGIDTKLYQPIERNLCKTILDIPQDKKVLMFAAEKLRDSRKGGDLILKALSHLPVSLKAETILVTIGSGNEEISKTVGIEALNFGYVSSDRLKSVIYSATDLFIFPTRADNLPLVLQESMACGTPMVSFKIGGVPDLVRPGITGYLAAPEDARDFANGIVRLLEDNQLRQQMRENCRAIALSEYALELQVKRYISLYDKLLNLSSS